MSFKGIILNQDITEFYVTRAKMIDKVDEEYLKKFIDQYKDTDVTDLCFNVNAIMSVFPSKVKGFYGDNDPKMEKLGISLEDGRNFTKGTDIIWRKKGLDQFKIWIDRCYEDHINPWISFRMNDAHCHYDDDNFLLDENFVKHNCDYARIRHRSQFQYYDRCRDYELEPVTKEMLDYIEETLERYDPYGIELDFQRETDCFAPGHEWNGQKIMTDFVKKVKKIVSNAEKRYDHKIKISAICNPNPIHCIEMGFDIAEWARLGLIDLYIPIGRWNTTDNDMPIKLWKQLMDKYSVEVAGGVQILVNNLSKVYKFVENTVETYFGSAAYILSQGADKLYLYNCMDSDDYMLTDADKNNKTENVRRTSNGYYRVLTTVGDIDKILQCNRKHILTYADKTPIWNRDQTGNCFSVLPSIVDSEINNPLFLKIPTGKISDNSKAIVGLGINENISPDESFDVFVNSIKAKYVGKRKCTSPYLTDNDVYCFEIDNKDYKSDIQIIEVLCRKDIHFVVDYAEVYIIPAE